MTAIRVLVADRRPLVAAVVEAVVADDDDIEVVARAYSTTDLISQCRTHVPDVAVVDLVLSGGAIGTLLRTGARVLLFGDELDVDRANAALFEGASGYFALRDTPAADIAKAVRTIGSGRAVLHPVTAAAILEQWRRMRRGHPSDPRGTSLTPRQLEILAGVADGLTTTAIAHRLGLAPKTVENHKSRIYGKLGTNNQAEAVAVATRRGWLPLDAGLEPGDQ